MSLKKKVLVIHGPNLNLLGEREKGIYGDLTLEKINQSLSKEAAALNLEVDFFQSNHEGEMVSKIHEVRQSVQGIIMNPAAYTHTSVALRDAVAAISIPVIEVHLSNIYSREDFRHHSFIAPVAKGQIAGFGALSYSLALKALKEIL